MKLYETPNGQTYYCKACEFQDGTEHTCGIYQLTFCGVCNQVTNFLNSGKCAKCKESKVCKHKLLPTRDPYVECCTYCGVCVARAKEDHCSYCEIGKEFIVKQDKPLRELLEDLFPKDVSKERGQALVLYAHAMMIINKLKK